MSQQKIPLEALSMTVKEMTRDRMATWPAPIRLALRQSLDRNVTTYTTLRQDTSTVFDVFTSISLAGIVLQSDCIGSYYDVHTANMDATKWFLFGGPWEAGTYVHTVQDYMVDLQDDGTVYLRIKSDRIGHKILSVEVDVRARPEKETPEEETPEEETPEEETPEEEKDEVPEGVGSSSEPEDVMELMELWNENEEMASQLSQLAEAAAENDDGAENLFYTED